jgi:hypothetical protein
MVGLFDKRWLDKGCWFDKSLVTFLQPFFAKSFFTFLDGGAKEEWKSNLLLLSSEK